MKRLLLTGAAALALAQPAYANDWGSVAAGFAGGIIAAAIAAQAVQAAAHPHYVFVPVPVRERRHVVHASPRPQATPHHVAHVASPPATPRPVTQHFGT